MNSDRSSSASSDYAPSCPVLGEAKLSQTVRIRRSKPIATFQRRRIHSASPMLRGGCRSPKSPGEFRLLAANRETNCSFRQFISLTNVTKRSRARVGCWRVLTCTLSLRARFTYRSLFSGNRFVARSFLPPNAIATGIVLPRSCSIVSRDRLCGRFLSGPMTPIACHGRN